LKERLEAAEAHSNIDMIAVVRACAIENKDWKAAQFLLMARLPEHFNYHRDRAVYHKHEHGHGKSLTASVYFPAWYLGLHPNDRIIACSYSAELSHTFSRQCRNIVMGTGYGEIFRNPAVAEQSVEVAQDSRFVARCDLAAPHRGGYVSAGVGGSITGKGANVLIIDDPVKDAEEAGRRARHPRSPLPQRAAWAGRAPRCPACWSRRKRSSYHPCAQPARTPACCPCR
jgi:hypothetical protein